MTNAIFGFILSLVVVLIGAKLFLKASISLAKILRFSEMVVGATLIAMATTMPEILISIFASASSHGQLAFGNVLGSGLFNLGFLFGLILLAGSHHKEKIGRGRGRSLILFALVLFVYVWFLLFGKMDFWAGAILIAFCFGFLIYTFHYALKKSGDNLFFIETELENHPAVMIKFVAGAFLLVVGARFLVLTGEELAKIMAIPEVLVGVTMLAVGTSLPELITAITAMFTGHEKLSLGNLTGATVITFTLALGLAALISEIIIPDSVLKFDFPVLLLFSGIGVVFAFLPRLPQRLLGGILLAGYLAYLVLLFR